jgi:hypothetical protein
MSDQIITETSTCQHTTLTTDRYPRPPMGFEPTISASGRLQTYVLDRAAKWNTVGHVNKEMGVT